MSAGRRDSTISGYSVLHRWAILSVFAAADNSSKNVGGQDCKRATIAYFFSVPLLSFHTPPPTINAKLKQYSLCAPAIQGTIPERQSV